MSKVVFEKKNTTHVFGDSGMRSGNFCGSSGRVLYQDSKRHMIVIRTNKDKKSREGK